MSLDTNCHVSHVNEGFKRRCSEKAFLSLTEKKSFKRSKKIENICIQMSFQSPVNCTFHTKVRKIASVFSLQGCSMKLYGAMLNW